MDGLVLIRVGFAKSDDVACSKRDLQRRSTFRRDDKDIQIHAFLGHSQTLLRCWEKPPEHFQEVGMHSVSKLVKGVCESES